MTYLPNYNQNSPKTADHEARLAALQALVAARVLRDKIAAELGLSLAGLVGFASRTGVCLPYQVRKPRGVVV